MKGIYNDFFGSVDSSDDSGSELDLLPGLFEVDDVDTLSIFMVDVSLHFVVEIQGTEVGLERLFVKRTRGREGTLLPSNLKKSSCFLVMVLSVIARFINQW